MTRNIVAGIDVGSAYTRVVICEYSKKDYPPHILAAVRKPTKGMRYGYVIDATEVGKSIRDTLLEAQKQSGVKLKSAVLGCGGVALGTVISSGTVAVARADAEVTELDVNRAIAASEASVSERPNIKILHAIPLEFKLDGKKLIGKPIGMNGGKLEVKSLFITAASAHVSELVAATEESGIEVIDVFALPLAESVATLSALQKNAGCVLADIGAETLSIVVFEEGVPISLQVSKIGSSDITKDIALGLKIPLETAEEIKLGKLEENRQISRRVAEIIGARLSDIFENIESHLKKINRNGLLPAGITLIGGGSEISGIEEAAREYLNLPARKGDNNPENVFANKAIIRRDTAEQMKYSGTIEKVRSPEWSATYGLCLVGLDETEIESIGITLAKKTRNRFLSFIKQFLP